MIDSVHSGHFGFQESHMIGLSCFSLSLPPLPPSLMFLLRILLIGKKREDALFLRLTFAHAFLSIDFRSSASRHCGTRSSDWLSTLMNDGTTGRASKTDNWRRVGHVPVKVNVPESSSVHSSLARCVIIAVGTCHAPHTPTLPVDVAPRFTRFVRRRKSFNF